MIPDAKAFGQWIKKRREDLGLTTEVLAASVECTKGYINKLENAAPHSSTGTPPAPTLQFLYSLSRSLGTSMATPLAKLGYLKRAEGDVENSHPIRILHYYNELTPEDQALAEAMVKALWMKQQRTDKQAEAAKPKPKTQKKKSA